MAGKLVLIILLSSLSLAGNTWVWSSEHPKQKSFSQKIVYFFKSTCSRFEIQETSYIEILHGTSRINGNLFQSSTILPDPFRTSPTKSHIYLEQADLFLSFPILLSGQARNSPSWWITTPVLTVGKLIFPYTCGISLPRLLFPPSALPGTFTASSLSLQLCSLSGRGGLTGSGIAMGMQGCQSHLGDTIRGWCRVLEAVLFSARTCRCHSSPE